MSESGMTNIAVARARPEPPVRAAQAIEEYSRARESSLRLIAYRARLPLEYCEAIVDGDEHLVDASEIRSIAQAIETRPSRLYEFRLAMVLQFLTHTPDRLQATFLRTLSNIEQGLLERAEFSDGPLGQTVKRLLLSAGLTRQDLTDGTDVTPAALTRALNGTGRTDVGTIESIAQSLGVPPELFLEYRIELVRDWLDEHPDEVDLQFEELSWEPTLEAYHEWTVRPLPHPLEAPPRDLLESLLEIVAAEGPVLGARVYQLRLAASNVEETRELRSLLNRASAALARSGRLIDDDERGRGTQMQRTLRLPEQAPCVQRTLGARTLWQVPEAELYKTLVECSAWKLRESVPRLQQAVADTYGLGRASRKDTDHLNRCITRARQGDAA